ncbi:glycosyltransferase family 2 protein [Roseovarius sp.]
MQSTSSIPESLTQTDGIPDHDLGPAPLDVSVITPIYNEEESIPALVERLFPVLDSLGCSYEVIAVNDGSSDNSQKILEQYASEQPHLKVVEFRRNAGQTAAMMAGIDYSRGKVIITIDADLQNDPADIPRLLEKLDEGHDVVSGWRKNRKDAKIRRNFVSRVANRIISKISGVELRDYGCTLKAYRREVLKGMRLYGEMHRFVPIYASWMGADVVEMEVAHHARAFGQSKYGLNRIFKVILDLIVIKFFSKYLVKPIYVFGGTAAMFFLCAVLAFFYMIFLKLAFGTSMIQTPLPILSAMMFMLSVVTLLMGILAEILVRTYFESQNRLPYSVRKTVNT